LRPIPVYYYKVAFEINLRGFRLSASVQAVIGVEWWESEWGKTSDAASAESHWHIEMIEWFFAEIYGFEHGYSVCHYSAEISEGTKP